MCIRDSQSSDNALKHNEIEITDGIDKINQLKPKYYFKSTEPVLDASGEPIMDWNGDVSDMSGNYETGLIAQELLETDLSGCVHVPPDASNTGSVDLK